MAPAERSHQKMFIVYVCQRRSSSILLPILTSIGIQKMPHTDLKVPFIIMFGMNKIKCRTCLMPNTKVQSLDSKPKMFNWDRTYKDLLKHIAKLEFDTKKESKMPQGVCSTCSKKLRDSYAYIMQIQECNSFFMDMVENISNKLHKHPSLDKDVVDESPCIKQEQVNALEDNDLCSTDSNAFFENVHTLSKEVVTLQRSTESLHTDVSFQMEQKYPKEIYPECVINEIDINDQDISSDSESKDHDDRLDEEAIEENKSTSVEDEMLPVRCDECERVFANSLLLTRHKKDTHLPDELKIQCPSCPVKFSRRNNMYTHMRTFHKSETVREHQIQPRKFTKTDICDQCHRSYSDKYKLMAHIKNKHGPGCAPKKPKQPPKQYLCTLCGLTCTNKSNLEIHYRRRHTGEKPFKCDFCDRCFTRPYEVKVHHRTHTGEAPYKCTVCEKAFKRSNKLKIHMLIHTNERPYKCTECEKAFRQSKDLNIHRRTHTGERPYKCNVCNSTFTQSNSLKLHQKKKKHFQATIGVDNSVEFAHAINTFL